MLYNNNRIILPYYQKFQKIGKRLMIKQTYLRISKLWILVSAQLYQLQKRSIINEIRKTTNWRKQ